MAYEPTVWASGDVITSAKLNKLEQGVASASGGGGGGGTGGGALIVSYTDRTEDETTILTLTSTWKEIQTAIASGKVIYLLVAENEQNYMAFLYIHGDADNNEYMVSFEGSFTFLAQNDTDYPEMTIS